ncbi:MAG TPA: glycosyl hydrolase 53 family protein [Chitinispirillaceae bacterium]|nr:glycosyl hydrolase 53 family protein [Chitinispirillaceae bacterium]
MIRFLPLILILLCFPAASAQSYLLGADLSFVPELESCGVQWKENNAARDVFAIFKDNGATTIRIRLWHSPQGNHSGFSDADTLIARSKKLGLNVILDFHYSDTWTDPSNQKCPAAWNGVLTNNTRLADSLYNYTKSVLQRLKDKGRMPEFVQVGNETNGGMCFGGDGKVTWPTDWTKMKLLFNAGIKAVRETDPSCKIILHVADPQHAEWWAGELNKNGVTDYDILGISYYPIIHTNKKIADVGTVISNIRNTYKKDVLIVETSLPWSNSWDDNTTNMMNGAPDGYGTDPTPEIQAKWLTDLSNKVKASGGLGVIYWEPEWVASGKASCPQAFGGSTWENQAFFDFNNNLMVNGGIRFFGKPIVNVNNQPPLANERTSLSTAHTSAGMTVTLDGISTPNARLTIFTVDGSLLYETLLQVNRGKIVHALPNLSLVIKNSVAILSIRYGTTTQSCQLFFR